MPPHFRVVLATSVVCYRNYMSNLTTETLKQGVKYAQN